MSPVSTSLSYETMIPTEHTIRPAYENYTPTYSTILLVHYPFPQYHYSKKYRPSGSFFIG